MYPCGQYTSQTLNVERIVSSLVCQPSKATKDEELPLVGSHSDIHDRLVDYLRLSCSRQIPCNCAQGLLQRLIKGSAAEFGV